MAPFKRSRIGACSEKEVAGGDDQSHAGRVREWSPHLCPHRHRINDRLRCQALTFALPRSPSTRPTSQCSTWNILHYTRCHKDLDHETAADDAPCREPTTASPAPVHTTRVELHGGRRHLQEEEPSAPERERQGH